MSVDLSQFFDVFFDEAEEHLANLESQVLGLNLAAPDPDTQNEIFRAAHSVKGGAATFGFKDMADLVHNVETLLDDVRKGRRALNTAMVETILETVDVLKAMAAGHRAGAPLPPSAGQALTARLVEMVRSAPEAISPAQASSSAGARSQPQPQSPPQVADAYRLEFCVQGDIDWHDLMTRLAEFQFARLVSFPLELDSSDPLVIDMDGTAAQLEKIIDSLVGLVPRKDISTRRRGDTPAPEAGKDEDFGFFDDPAPPPVQEDDSFGFFGATPAAPLPKAAVSEEESFGFFDAPPAVPDLLPVVAADAGLVEDAAAEKPGALDRDDPELPKAMPQAPEAKLAEPVLAAGAPTHAAPAREAKSAESGSIRVGVEKVDQLLNLVGELVITQSMLVQCGGALDPVAHERLLEGIGLLERNTRELQESVMSIRMLPISAVFNRYPRLVRDIAGRLGKKVELKLIGEHTELDKGFIEKLSDPLTHLVRNSLDHGIEAPEVRVTRGKPESGTLTLRAFHQGGSIVIQVGDDGGGLSREKILAKARERGLPVNDAMSDQDVWALIFEPGFSTAATITDVSGRGVGMDVVRSNIQQMGGRIDIESMYGIGTTMTLRLPLTLAILDGMSIAVGEETFIVPLSFIIESLQPRSDEVRGVAGHGRVVQVRGDYLPLIAMHEVFGIVPRVTEVSRGLCVLLEADGERVALLVDDLLGQQQVVVKNLETNYRKVPGVSGATIMGDGRIALIVDVPSIIRLARGSDAAFSAHSGSSAMSGSSAISGSSQNSGSNPYLSHPGSNPNREAA